MKIRTIGTLLLGVVLMLAGTLLRVDVASAATPQVAPMAIPQVGVTLPGEVLVQTVSSSPDSIADPYYVDEGFKYFYFWATGAEAPSNVYEIRVAITTRAWSRVIGGLPEQVDAAASMYRTSTASVGNIQIDWVQLRGGAKPGHVKTENTKPVNSSTAGNPIKSGAPYVCVSPFGTGVYFGFVGVSWRNTYEGLLKDKQRSSDYGRSRYATLVCP